MLSQFLFVNLEKENNGYLQGLHFLTLSYFINATFKKKNVILK